MTNAPLYDRDILRLAASLHRWPLEGDYAHTTEQRAPVCGSTITLGIDYDDSGRISRIGVDVQACALGQAAAAIVASHAVGLSLKDMAERTEHIQQLLDDGDVKDAMWPELELLARAAPYPARHGAILLPYKALMAISSDTLAAKEPL